MAFKIIEKQPQQIVSIRVVGPYHETIPKGFDQLSSLYTQYQIPGKDWLALYWDNPETNPPAELRADVSLSVADDYVLPPELSDHLQLQVIPAGLYAVYHTRVSDDDYAKAWGNYITSICHKVAIAQPKGRATRFTSMTAGLMAILILISINQLRKTNRVRQAAGPEPFGCLLPEYVGF